MTLQSLSEVRDDRRLDVAVYLLDVLGLLGRGIRANEADTNILIPYSNIIVYVQLLMAPSVTTEYDLNKTHLVSVTIQDG